MRDGKESLGATVYHLLMLWDPSADRGYLFFLLPSPGEECVCVCVVESFVLVEVLRVFIYMLLCVNIRQGKFEDACLTFSNITFIIIL